MKYSKQLALGLVFKRLRKGKGLTQVQLAPLAGVQRTWLSELESGDCNPTIDTLDRLAVVLGVSLSEVFKQVEIVSSSMEDLC